MSKTIILVEDNAQNRYLVTYLLEAHGYDVVPVTDGNGAIAIAGQIKPIAILLDIQLPVLDGYAVAKILSSEPHLSSVPIIAVTSYAMPGDREKSLAAGCSGYIEKPIDPETFVAQIEQLLPAKQPA